MFAQLLLLFAVVPLIDLWLLVKIGAHAGVWTALALAFLPSLLGAAMAKREGLKVLRGWSQAMAERRLPEEGLISGVLVILGAGLLITPGLISDTAGLLLLFAPTRRLAARLVRGRLSRRLVVVGAVGSRIGRRGEAPRARDQVVDVEPEHRDTTPP